MLKPAAWKGSNKSWHPHPYSLAHRLCWAALCLLGMREQPSIKALEKTTPHLLLPNLKTNSEAALRYIPHHISFSLSKTSLQTLWRSRFSSWTGTLQLSLGCHKQLLESIGKHLSNMFQTSWVSLRVSAPLQTQGCSAGNILMCSVMCACISHQNKDTYIGIIPLLQWILFTSTSARLYTLSLKTSSQASSGSVEWMTGHWGELRNGCTTGPRGP